MDSEQTPGVADMFGVKFQLGQTVVYPNRRGSVLELKSMEVSEIDPAGKITGYNKNGRRVTVKNLHMTAVVRQSQYAQPAVAAAYRKAA